MKLMIIESPGKVAKLASILGADYKIVASIGHVRDLPTDDITLSAPDFRPTYVLPKISGIDWISLGRYVKRQ